MDLETLGAFPFVDVIVRGEADETFPLLLDALRRGAPLSGVAGITYRGDGGAARTADAPLITNLDALAPPSYHLWPQIEKQRAASLEVGRGCPFTCAFCSSSPFFRRRYRLKSPDSVIRQMQTLRNAYRIDTFHLIHDAFTVRRRSVASFCEALLDSGERFHWTCSARTDCVDEDLLDLMREAGCSGVFFGVETGSARMQRIIGKGLDIDEALAAVRCASRLGIKTTVSTITGFPEETTEDLRATVDILADVLRFEFVGVELHLLAPVAGSALHERYRGRLIWDGIVADAVLQSRRTDSADFALAHAWPEVFPDFHAIPAGRLDRAYLVELRDFLTYGIARFRWLMIALHQYAGSLVDVFERWRAWRLQDISACEVEPAYYAGRRFRRAFLDFTASVCRSGGESETLAVATLLEYETGLGRGPQRDVQADRRNAGAGRADDLRVVPLLAPGVTLISLSANYADVIESLRNRRPPGNVRRQPTVVADIQAPDGSVRVLQLSSISASLAGLCDGQRTAGEIGLLLRDLHPDLKRCPAGAAGLFALNELAKQGLIVFSTA